MQHVVHCGSSETGRHHLVQLHLLVGLLASRVRMRIRHTVVRLMRRTVTALAEKESAGRRALLVARGYPAGLVVADDTASLLAGTWTASRLLLALAHARSIQHGELESLHLARVHMSVPLVLSGSSTSVVAGLG